jgi:hypothetical protein
MSEITTPQVQSVLDIARAGLAGSQDKLNRALINERLLQRQVLIAPNASQYRENLAKTQEEIRILKASIEVLEEIIAEEEKKTANSSEVSA